MLLNSPLEEEKIEMVEFLGEEVAQDASGIAAADLIGWQGEVDALDKVPELSHWVLIEHPGRKQEEIQRGGEPTRGLFFTSNTHPAFLSDMGASHWISCTNEVRWCFCEHVWSIYDCLLYWPHPLTCHVAKKNRKGRRFFPFQIILVCNREIQTWFYHWSQVIIYHLLYWKLAATGVINV